MYAHGSFSSPVIISLTALGSKLLILMVILSIFLAKSFGVAKISDETDDDRLSCLSPCRRCSHHKRAVGILQAILKKTTNVSLLTRRGDANPEHSSSGSGLRDTAFNAALYIRSEIENTLEFLGERPAYADDLGETGRCSAQCAGARLEKCKSVH